MVWPAVLHSSSRKVRPKCRLWTLPKVRVVPRLRPEWCVCGLSFTYIHQCSKDWTVHGWVIVPAKEWGWRQLWSSGASAGTFKPSHGHHIEPNVREVRSVMLLGLVAWLSILRTTGRLQLHA